MQLGAGYKAYVFGGLAVVIAVTVIASLSSPNQTGEGVLPIVIGTVAVWIFGLLALQWRAVMKGRGSEGPDPNAALAGAGTDDAGQVASYEELMALLATEDYDEARVRRGRSGSYSILRSNMLLVTIVTPICLVLGYLGASGNLPNVGDWKYWPAVPFVLAPIAIGFIYRIIGRAGEAATDQLAPLGLRITEMPKPGMRPVPFGSWMQSDVRGATVMSGSRHGRPVEVRMDARRHTTTVSGRSPEFEIEPDDERLKAKPGAPATIAEAVAGLGPSKRWKKLKSVKGGAEGIVAERKVDAESGWLWDLWLCETLASALAR